MPGRDEEEDVRPRVLTDQALAANVRVGLQLTNFSKALRQGDLIPDIEVGDTDVHGVEPASAAFRHDVAVRKPGRGGGDVWADARDIDHRGVIQARASPGAGER